MSEENIHKPGPESLADYDEPPPSVLSSRGIPDRRHPSLYIDGNHSNVFKERLRKENLSAQTWARQYTNQRQAQAVVSRYARLAHYLAPDTPPHPSYETTPQTTALMNAGIKKSPYSIPRKIQSREMRVRAQQGAGAVPNLSSTSRSQWATHNQIYGAHLKEKRPATSPYARTGMFNREQWQREGFQMG
eukprot:gnl/Trimastix_PCT/3098.p1 GENE.gnl/Trimastix_PCT/3098~~gnl/Trimastix_PCT/3098.p1  ORF type:complete len:189 (+),score=6.41 gnl/Trimastix_PCT/3098:70-636(+)